MLEGSRASRYPPPLPFRLRSSPWFLRPRRISSRNLRGICSARARSAMRIGSSGSPSASASRALIAYLAFFESMSYLVCRALEYSRVRGRSSRLTDASHPTGTENLVVHRKDATDCARKHEFLLVALSRTPPHSAAQVGIGQQLQQSFLQCTDVLPGDRKTGVSVAHRLGHSSNCGGDDGKPGPPR